MSPLTLTAWFRYGTAPTSASKATRPPTQPTQAAAASPPRVLLMDGGVSTHLESLIAPSKFSHRHLWSSSLLLDDKHQKGHETIVKGHKDWLHAGVNIITTVTYQCHYGLVLSSENPPPPPPPASAVAAVDGDKTIIFCDDDNNSGSTVGMSTDEMLRLGVSLARRAVKESNPATMHSSNNIIFPTFVVASTGPYGAAMADGSEYTGQYPVEVTRDKLKEFHRRKASTILSNHPDGIAIETIPNLEEVGVVCEVMKELLQQHQQQQQQQEGDVSLSPRTCCCWISLACKNDHELNDGHTVQEALDLIQLYDPDCEWISAIGVNCCDSAVVPNLVKLLTLNALSVATRENITATDERDSSSTVAVPEQQQPKQKTYQHLPTRGIVVYPNSGESWDAANNDWKDGTGATDVEFTDRLTESVELVYGLWNGKITTKMKKKPPYLPQPPRIVLGGCCRTNPETIALLRQRIDDWKKKKQSNTGSSV